MEFYDLAKDLLLESSPNDPIPELTRKKNNLAILLIGSAASGKTSFYKNFIVPRQGNIKIFSTDLISNLRVRRDPRHQDKEEGDYVSGSSGMRHQYVKNFIKSQGNDNFVLDTTGIDPKKKSGISRRLKVVYNTLEEEGYDIIFTHVLTPVERGVTGAKQREKGSGQPETDVDYIKKTYTEPEQIEKDKFADFEYEDEDLDYDLEPLNTKVSQKIISRYASWGNDPYYIALNIRYKADSKHPSDDEKRKYYSNVVNLHKEDGDYEIDWIFYKYEGGQLKVRKGDKYVPVNKS